MSLPNIVKSIGIVGLVLSPLACGALSYQRLYEQHPVKAYEQKKEEPNIGDNVFFEMYMGEGAMKGKVVVTDMVTARSYKLMRSDNQKKSLRLEEVTEDRPYWEKIDDW